VSTSPSSPGAVRLTHKTRENLDLLASYARGRQKAKDLDMIFEDLEEYDELLRSHCGKPLAEAAALEVGFGPRPHRLLAMLARGVDVIGVDMEVPLLRGRPAELARIRRKNGTERMVKSPVRFALFDRAERSRLRSRLAERGERLVLDERRLLVRDAPTLDLAPGSLDLIVSEDVFEHIARPALAELVARMRSWRSPTGLALIRPNVYTGITGGHQNEWGRWSFDGVQPTRRSGAWDHLRDRRTEANSHLNELWRRDYRELFAADFEVLEERVKVPGLGREWLTPALGDRLGHVPDEELFSNQVLFVLRPRAQAAA